MAARPAAIRRRRIFAAAGLEIVHALACAVDPAMERRDTQAMHESLPPRDHQVNAAFEPLKTLSQLLDEIVAIRHGQFGGG